MTDLATAYANAGKALLDLADALVAAGDGPSATLPFEEYDVSEAETLIEAEQIKKAHGSAAVCPAHNIEYREGKFGPYCPSLGTDPKWTNQRGYCQITPKNAAAYLRQKAAG